MADSTPSDASAATRPRWPYQGTPQVLLLVAGLVATVASFLPWLETPFGGASGALLGGTVTFYAAVFAVPGAMWRRRGIVLAHALILALPGIVVPLWRLAWAMRRLPGLGQAWLPGPGLVLVLISGCVAAYAAVRLWQRTPLHES
jgi:hypothetical protein